MQKKSSMTPLWVISLFLTLTETTLGIGVIQTSGGVQVALTVFVLALPSLVAIAFFCILWFKPYVLYSPYEYRSAKDTSTFIKAITQNAEKIQRKALEASATTEKINTLKIEITENIKKLDEKLQVKANEIEAAAEQIDIMKEHITKNIIDLENKIEKAKLESLAMAISLN